MKKLIVVGIGTIALFSFLLTACKKEKEDPKDLNVITISGSAFEGLNGVYTPSDGFYTGSYLYGGCDQDIFQSYFEVKCEGGLELGFWLFTAEDQSEIPTGTFNVGGECETGFALIISPASVKGAKVRAITTVSGTLKINKEGAVYDVDIDAVIHPEADGGKIKGNFSGLLPMATK